MNVSATRIKSVLMPPLMALQFLTTIPVPLKTPGTAQQFARSSLYYPLVGILLGSLLWAGSLLITPLPLVLQSALLLTFWVALTGALHLDGLADTADAWIGGLGDKERTLAIMKDPCCGPVAVVSIMLLLLLKFAALYALLQHQLGSLLLLVPWISRCQLPLLWLTAPYIRDGGAGVALQDYLPRKVAPWVILVSLLPMLLFGWTGGLVIVSGMLCFILFRGLFMRRLGGFTGDMAGTMLELTECIILLTLAICLPLMAA
ncbi:MAG: adenosylcobinamide-GDP ribazoletransferase [Enterobacteriaceae bacterium]